MEKKAHLKSISINLIPKRRHKTLGIIQHRVNYGPRGGEHFDLIRESYVPNLQDLSSKSPTLTSQPSSLSRPTNLNLNISNFHSQIGHAVHLFPSPFKLPLNLKNLFHHLFLSPPSFQNGAPYWRFTFLRYGRSSNGFGDRGDIWPRYHSSIHSLQRLQPTMTHETRRWTDASKCWLGAPWPPLQI